MKILELQHHLDERGGLVVIESDVGFKIERVYFIHDAEGRRGEHAHHKTTQALVAVAGACKVSVWNGVTFDEVALDSRSKCLILDPHDYHYMEGFSCGCVLLVMASEPYDPADYIDNKEFFNE